MHSTDNLEDGYLGSGKILGYSRAKYGDENHVREIVEYCLDRTELRQREKEIVNEELLKDPLNINLKYGGEGGWDHIKNSEAYKEQQIKAGRNGGFANPNKMSEAARENFEAKAPWNKEKMVKAILTRTRRINNGEIECGFAKCTHSDKSKVQMSLTKKQRKVGIGNKNSNFGKRNKCVSKDNITKRILVEEIEEYLKLGWVLGIKKFV
jgi:hypothetical protein